MQKIKNIIIKKCIDNKITSRELDFLIYISHYQDSTGRVLGVYYRDVCAALSISIQTFYDVKASLIKKGIISVSKNSEIDWDILIEDNDFSMENYHDGYINTDSSVFYTKEFGQLKAGAKLMLMDLMRLTYSNRGRFIIKADNLYKKYMELFRVTKRVVRKYLSSIKKFFSITLSEFKYTIFPLAAIKERKNNHDDEIYNKKAIETLCRRNKIKGAKAKQIKDTAALISQYRAIAMLGDKNIIDAMEGALKGSLEAINRYLSPKEKYRRELRPALVHKLLREQIELYC